VVFSFFKKDPKERGNDGGKAPGGRSSTRSVGRPLPGPVNRNAATTTPRVPAPNTTTAPDKNLARSLALETAAKIDAIESEMARDFLRPGAPTEFPNSAANSTLARPSQQPVQAPAAIEKTTSPPTLESLDLSTDDWHGNANAIELHAEGSGSAIEETAILFANGLIEPAEAGLRAAIQADSLGDTAQRGWLMLFELLQQRGDKAGFDSLTIEYVLRFESSPPAWIEYRDDAPTAAAAGGAAKPAGAAVIVLPDVIDAGVVKHLEQLKQQSLVHQSITLDASNVRAADMVGAELLLRVINAFKRASHELIVMGADQLVTPLRGAVEAGRRDPSDAVWMLLLEVFRLLNRQHDFEETGIQYCITYEVSPPSWEPPPPNLKTRAAQPQTATVTDAGDDGLQWRGTLRGEGEPHFGRLIAASKVDKNVVIDCTYLKRVEFATATGMLAMLTKVRQGGATVEFRNVNYLIAALFGLLGIDAVAQVQLRRI
jgi:anti-anti-sigma regulatory factor